MLRVLMTSLVTLAIGSGCASAGNRGAAGDRVARPRVGVYDARAVAVAFVASSMHDAELKAQMADLAQAKVKGDQKAVAELEAWGKSAQARRHLQGFAGTPVDDILYRVADRLPSVATAAGVDAIVRKGEFVSERSELVDITDDLVKLFDPSEKTLRTINDLKKRPPLNPKTIKDAERTGII